jgi:hypothetical protein
MSSDLLSAAIAGLVALIVAIITIRNGTLRDRESDWRRMKLDMYRDYVLAIAGMVEGRANDAAKTRYLDASHSLMLIASPDVLRVLFDFQNDRLDKKYLTPLFVAIRNDIKPRPDHMDQGIEFQMFNFIGSPESKAHADAIQSASDQS